MLLRMKTFSMAKVGTSPPMRAGRWQNAQSERRRVRVQVVGHRRILPQTVAAALLVVVMMIVRRAAMRW